MAYGETNLTFVATLTTLLFCSLYIHSQTQQATAPVAYDYDERSDWRPVPRPVTQPRPYQRPAPRVAYPKPTTRPTAAPKKAQKAAPASCVDDATWYYGMDKKNDCAHVAEKPQKRCQTSDGTRTGLEACPRSCGVPCSVSYAPTSVAEFSHKPSMRPTRKPHAFIRYDDDDSVVVEDVPYAFPWWRLTFGIVVLGGLAWVFTKSTLDGAYDRLSRTVPLPGAVFGGGSSEYERV